MGSVYNIVNPVRIWPNIGLSLRPYYDPIHVGEAMEDSEARRAENILKKRLEGDELQLCIGAEEQGNSGPV